MHNRDRKILEALQRTWGVGKIYKQSDDASVYRVSSLRNLKVIINHFVVPEAPKISLNN